MISSERLELLPLTATFFETSLASQQAKAEALLEVAIPAEWFEEQALMRLRLGQLQQNPALEPWLLRAICLRRERVMVGHIGFHDLPGAAYLHAVAPHGVEFGYTVFTEYRRQGFAKEAIGALITWAHQDHNVSEFVVSIGPDNEPSIRLAQHLGFRQVGSHVDEEDGLEGIFLLRYEKPSLAFLPAAR